MAGDDLLAQVDLLRPVHGVPEQRLHEEGSRSPFTYWRLNFSEQCSKVLNADGDIVSFGSGQAIVGASLVIAPFPTGRGVSSPRRELERRKRRAAG